MPSAAALARQRYISVFLTYLWGRLLAYSNEQNFMSIGRGLFIRQVPENYMFPWEKEVVSTTLAHDSRELSGLKIKITLPSGVSA